MTSVSSRSSLSRFRPRDAADWLFAVQLCGAVGMMVPQLIRNWTEVGGVSMAFLIALLAFVSLQLSLAISSHRVQPTRKSWQARFIFLLWTTLVSLEISEIFFRGVYEWDRIDTVVLSITIISMAGVILYTRLRKRSLADPATRSQLAMATRGVPQIFQGIKFGVAGGAGFTAVAVLVGNINIWIRLRHLFLTRQESTGESNRHWMLASEIANAVTWAFASLVWLSWRVGLLVP